MSAPDIPAEAIELVAQALCNARAIRGLGDTTYGGGSYWDDPPARSLPSGPPGSLRARMRAVRRDETIRALLRLARIVAMHRDP